MRIEILFGTIFILCFLLCCIAQFPEMRTCPICDDSNPCTLDKCVNFSCIYEPLTGNVSGCYEEHGNCSFSTCEAGKCITKIVEKCCGNGVCEEGENCLTCKEDCWACTNISEYLVPPIVPSYLPREVPPEPEVNSRVPILISLKFEITTYGIFEKYGGVIGIKAISDTNTFLKNVKVIANYTKQAELQGAWSIKASGSLDLGLLHITGPERSGIYSFKICADTIATRNNLSYLFENLCTNPVNIYVLELPNLTNYSIIFDPLISGQIRPYLDFSEGMGELIKNATSAFPGDYNIYQVAYIFDWVRKNVNYTRTYYWMNASEIFSKKYGDCKHFSILLSSFIMELGG
ncbi:MAG: hypothetical protein QXX05_02850, partial [Candidatus Nanoarchaeia archaeon]|nr:hypothetical protein [Candidatus Haiyanarchaeum thermophilum]MCW1306757.1 hypothetical protein [Candidatus Haiyanarchaeum thermophilum]